MRIIDWFILVIVGLYVVKDFIDFMFPHWFLSESYKISSDSVKIGLRKTMYVQGRTSR